MQSADVPEELFARLLDVCHEGGIDAIRLAARTRARELHSLLMERAAQYRSAEEELRARLPVATAVDHSDRAALAEEPDGDSDVVRAWEFAECSALIFFRDAYDANLPVDLKATVKRHLEEGVVALERLRALEFRENAFAPSFVTEPNARSHF